MHGPGDSKKRRRMAIHKQRAQRVEKPSKRLAMINALNCGKRETLRFDVETNYSLRFLGQNYLGEAC